MGIAQQAYAAARARLPVQVRRRAARGIEAAGTATSMFRMLPSFLIVGGQRCGTNFLYESLVAHPRIGRASPRSEVHYFDLGYERGIDWYRGHFPSRWPRPIPGAPGPVVAGESSPYYMFHPLAPHRIAATLPDVKLIVLLRDPVARAYSHYHHERSRGREHLPIEEAIEAEPTRLAGEEARILADPRYHSFSHRHLSYVARGRYADQLSVLSSLFPPERMCVLLSERLFAEPQAELRTAFEFLGLPAGGVGFDRPLNVGRYEAMSRSVKRRLVERFSDSNQRLSLILGSDVPWL